MSALATRTDEEFATRSTIVGLTRHAVEATRRSGFHVVGALGRSECTCPHDCERDHPNE